VGNWLPINYQFSQQRTRWKLDAVGARKKAQQWMESDETSAEKIGRTIKTKKHKKQTEISNTGKY
jgi:hypothetical protein